MRLTSNRTHGKTVANAAVSVVLVEMCIRDRYKVEPPVVVLRGRRAVFSCALPLYWAG